MRKTPKYLKQTFFSFVLMYFHFTSCGPSDQTKTETINLRKIDVSERQSVNIDASVDSAQDNSPFGDGSSGSKPDDGGSGSNQVPAGSTPGGSQGGQLPGQSQPSGPSTVELTDSVKVFEKTVYPLARASCAGGCHDSAIAPVFASANVVLAHDTVLSSHKVDFVDVPKSRLVLRMLPDQHRCPASGCEAAAKSFQSAIEEWSKQVGDTVAKNPAGQPMLLTAARGFVSPESSRMDNGLPPGVFLFEAEGGQLKAPMVTLAVDGSSGGMVVHTPAGAGNQVNIATAENQANLGAVSFEFDVIEAGSYQMIGRINAPANANSSFYIKMDASPLVLWDFGASAANYVLDVADAAAGVGTPHSFNLMPGRHRVEIRQRQEQTKVDMFALTTDPTIDLANLKPVPKEIRTIGFDLSEVSGVQGAKLTVEVMDYSSNAYMFKNLRIVVPSGSVLVKGVKLLVNGKYLPQHATYTTVDATVAAPGGLLSGAALVAIKDKGPDMDQFSFAFDKLEKAP